jgi:ParB family chromosome partitioning protein
MKVKINDIVIGRRIRKEPGDLVELRESMGRLGLINPVVINQDRELLAGFRRIMAARELGWTEIDCRIIHTRSKIEKLNIENDENLGRKNFTLQEIAKYREIREYLSARGFKKFQLWLQWAVKKVRQWINGLLSR